MGGGTHWKPHWHRDLKKGRWLKNTEKPAKFGSYCAEMEKRTRMMLLIAMKGEEAGLQQGLTFNRVGDLARSGVEELEPDTVMLLGNTATYSKKKVAPVLPLC